MMPLRKRRRVQVIAVAAVALILSSAMIGYAARQGISYYRSPAQVMAALPPPSETFRLGGLVETGSLLRGQGEVVSFRVTDCEATVPVRFAGILPDLFEENQSTIALGQLGPDGTFVATEVLAKHDETYEPREVTESLSPDASCPTLTEFNATLGAPTDG